MTTVSVAIPCYNAAETIEAVVNELRAEFAARSEYDYQIVLVNDCSQDDTFSVIRRLCRSDPRITGVDLSRNFGQTVAKMAALPYVTGDVLVYMDDDGQHPADRIFDLVEKVLEGNDLVYARFSHKHHSLFKRFGSWLNSRLLEMNGTKPRGIALSSYYAMDRVALEALKKYKSPFPSMGGYLSHVARSYANVDMDHRTRLAGRSNYTLGRMLKLWLTGFTNFSTVPLRVGASVGIVCACAGFITGAAVIIRKLRHPGIVAGYTSSIAVQLFIGGVIMMLLGLCGEYIGRIYMTVSNMPQYEVRHVVRGGDGTGDAPEQRGGTP